MTEFVKINRDDLMFVAKMLDRLKAGVDADTASEITHAIALIDPGPPISEVAGPPANRPLNPLDVG